MRTMKKMKDFDTKFEEWWKVAKEYFANELEKNLAQHRTNERNRRFKLEIYQKNNLEFVCRTLTSTKALSQDEEDEARLSRIA
jgi:arginyl-tRNA synthetase